MCPNDLNTLYISISFDPSDTKFILGVCEIFKGVANDKGTIWMWMPITENSTRDNIRPIVPAWDENNIRFFCLCMI